MKKLRFVYLALGVLVLAMASTPSQAQFFKKGKKGKGSASEAAAKPDKKDGKTPKELLKNCVAYEGLFTIHRDTLTGASYMAVKADQLNQPFIYFSFIEDGILDAGFFRGSYQGSKIITFTKHFDRIEINHENSAYYYDENNALSKAGKANINTPILASEKIEATDETTGTVYISGDKIFLSEQFQMIKPPSSPERPGMLGSLSKEKTKIEHIRSYPENTDISVSYVYDNSAPKRGGSNAVTDPRAISVRYQHSLIALPENDFKPRRDDGRIGFFSTQVDDMTSFEVAPYRDMIHRWHLVKKDPNAELSDPVEPITWWIENTTPVEFRNIMKDGVERWNVAFEKAGFTNAVVVKVQPDDADWDAGDIRYNVLRWTSSPQPPFGGYGPSFVNPLTGQILGADIMFEFAAIKGRLFREEVFTEAGMVGEAEKLTKEEMVADMHRCAAGEVMHHNMLFGLHAMRAMNMGDAANKAFVQQTLHRLALHEVGHTLGMSHNMRASTLLSLDEIHNPEIVAQKGLCNSVMEYPAINFPAKEEYASVFFDANPGPYDMWVIEYGYSPAVEDPAAEEARLESILSRSNRHELAFGNDADDMRSPGKAINPQVNIYDLTSDPVAYAAERCDLVRQLMPNLKSRYIVEGENFHELRNAFLVLTGEYATQLGVMSRWIGGVQFERTVSSQNPASRPFEPVAKEKQAEAMQALAKYAFAPDAFSVPDDLYNYLQMQRRGFDFFSSGEDPKILERNAGAQEAVLAHVLHPSTLQRIVDSEHYGNTYTLDLVMTDLTDAIFKADLKTKVNAQRQNLQIMYVASLVKMLDAKANIITPAKSMAIHELKRIRMQMATAAKADTQTKAHRDHVVMLVDHAMEAK
jgi:hypothetical protein